MKKIITAILLMTGSQAATFDISGTFENTDGCRIFNIMCSNYEQNGCRFELYIDGEYKGVIGKNGEASLSHDQEAIEIKDKGFRSTMAKIPSFVNRRATITNFEGHKDPYSYTDLTVTSFDIEFKGGIFSKIITCKNLKYVDEY